MRGTYLYVLKKKHLTILNIRNDKLLAIFYNGKGDCFDPAGLAMTNYRWKCFSVDSFMVFL